jgi:hypothetical protein
MNNQQSLSLKRQRASKDNLLYIIPSPVIIDSRSIKHKNIAYYTLEKSILTLHANGVGYFPAPVSIDPSIIVTTTADFMTGNHEGMISFDVDSISRAVPSGGSIGNWIATTSFTTPRYLHTSCGILSILQQQRIWNSKLDLHSGSLQHFYVWLTHNNFRCIAWHAL